MALNPALKALVSKAESKYSGGGGKTVKPSEGRTTWRIMAPKPGEQFWADLGVHWIKADENGKPIAVVGDVEVVYQRPSEIAAAIQVAIANAVDESSKKLFESWKSRKTVLLNAIDRAKNEVVVLELTPTLFGQFLGLMNMYDDAGQDITDPVSGVDVVITRVGKGLNTTYSIAVAPGVSAPVTKDQMEKCSDLMKFIESNYFRGEEQKALNAIAQIAGIPIPRIGGASVATPTAALTSTATHVADAKEEVAVPPVDHAAQAAEEAVKEARRQEIIKRQQEAARAAEAELAALNAPAAPVAPTTATPPLASDDADAILSELDGLLNT